MAFSVDGDDMRFWKLAVLGIVIAANLPSAEGQIFPGLSHTKARRVCCLKDYGYSVDQRTNPVTAVSFATVNTVSAGQVTNTRAAIPENIKAFPLRQSSLRLDHCEISAVAFVVHRNGRWTLNLKATQDPMLVNVTERPRFVRYQQNKFYLTVRAYTDFSIAGTEDSVLGKPALRSLSMEPFWIQRGRSVNLMLTSDQYGGPDRDLEYAFDLLQRVEIDLQYE